MARRTGAIAAALVAAASLAGAMPKKVIYFGWGIPDTRFVRDHWREMERVPLDGTAIAVYVGHDGGPPQRLGLHVFGDRAYGEADVAHAIEDLRAARWTRFTDNFAIAAPGHGTSRDSLWFDDDRWTAAVENWRVLASVARAGGLRGIILDPEHYTTKPFSHVETRPDPSVSFAVHREKVRARGRDVMAAIRTVYPDITIVALYGHTLVTRGPNAHRETHEYALYPAFLDGLLESSALGARLVDGFEFAYGYKERAAFEEARRIVREDALRTTAAPDRYGDQVEVGFGLWLDHGGAKAWHPDDPTANYFTPDEFRHALAQALATTDRYVWIYSQVPRFFPVRHLPDAYLDALRAARRPVQ